MGNRSQVCRALGMARSGVYRLSSEPEEDRQMREAIVEKSKKHPRYGYRRITAMLRREGWKINAKRVARIRREEGFKVIKKQRRTRRHGESTAERQQAARGNHVWSWDFVEDQTENGSRFRVLTLIDEHTRRCLALHVAWTIRAVDVIAVVEGAFARHGHPEHIRSDNGPEFIAYVLQDWLAAREVKTLYIQPGSPWENGYVESFHDKLRDECLNRELFGSLAEARVILEGWRKEYNGSRPHSALGYLTPDEYAQSGLEKMAPSAVGFTRPTKRVPREAASSLTSASFELK